MKLLLIDDEEGVRKIFSISLSREGYEVFTAASGKEGLEVFNRESPPVVITDLKMPGMDGLEVLRRIKEQNPHTEVIILTGHGDMESAIQALQLDASDFITKPVKDEALTIALRRAGERIHRRELKAYATDLESMVQAATEEITRRREFEGRLIQSSIDGIVATDEGGTIIIYNRTAESIFGYPRTEVLNRMKVNEIFPSEIADEVKNNLFCQLPLDAPTNWKEVSVTAKHGEKVPALFSGNVICQEGEVVGSVSFFHDLRQLKKLEQELIQSERLAAIGQTTAGIAHYIKNILNGLKGGVYVANDALEKNNMERFKTGWEMLQRNVTRISDLVFELLYYSKDREPEYTLVSPNEVARDIYTLLEHRARDSQITLVRDLDSSLEPVPLDPKGIHHALLNLASNAIDACVSDTLKDTGEVRIKTGREDNLLIFEVSDNGVGMDEEVQEMLFTSFFSTKGGRGTGLGLLMTQKIIEEHGGTISVDSQKGKGSTFTVRIPIEPVKVKKGGS